MNNIYPSEKGIHWLLIILKNRISNDLNINIEKKKICNWIIYIPFCDKKIILEYNPIFYSTLLAREMNFSRISVINKFFDTDFSILAAPGSMIEHRGLIKKSGDSLSIKYDILGLIYYMLCRIEEINIKSSL